MGQESGQKNGYDILVIEDDPFVAKTIGINWPNPSDRLHFISTYRQANRYLSSGGIEFFEGVIADLYLPDGDGLSILREIRGSTDVPVVLISGAGTGTSRADAIDLGADDYVMKPFTVRELQARLSRAIRNRQASLVKEVEERFEIAMGVICSVSDRTILRQGRMENLTDAEVRLLSYLNLHRGKACHRSSIYKNVFYRPHDPSDKTLDVYIGRLRKRMLSLGIKNPEDVIQTIRGYGYRIT